MFYNPKIIKGLRILIASEPDYDKYYVHYEFTSNEWKECTKMILKDIAGKKGVRIQTAHPYLHNDNETIWVYNDTLFYDDL